MDEIKDAFYVGFSNHLRVKTGDLNVLKAALSLMQGDQGQLFRVQTMGEAESLYTHTTLCTAYQMDISGKGVQMQLLEGEIFLSINPPPTINNNGQSSLPAADSGTDILNNLIPAIRSCTAVVPAQSFANWICIGNNAYGICQNIGYVYRFLTDPSVVYPMAIAYPGPFQGAVNVLRQRYAFRYFTIFGSSMPNPIINLMPDTIYQDPDYARHMKNRRESSDWFNLLKNGVFQPYERSF